MITHKVRTYILAIVELARQRNENVDEVLLAHVARLCSSDGKDFYKGRKPEIARLMSDLSGKNVTRDMVRAWLHPDKNKRRQPSVRYGLLLIAAGMLADSEKPTKPKPQRRR